MENPIAEKKDLYESSNKFSLTKFVFNLKTSKLYFWTVNLLNLLLSLACIVIYIYMTYKPQIFLINNTFFYFNFFCRILFLIDFIFDLIIMAIEKKLNYLGILVDVISIFPFFIMRFICGMRFDLINNADMIISSFITFRLIKIQEYAILFKSDTNRELFLLATTIISLLTISSAELNVWENTQTIGNYWLFLERDCTDSYNCEGSNDYFHTTFFFLMTLFSTIGYYSSTTSLIGRILIIVLIVIQVVVLPQLVSGLMSLVYSKSSYSRMSYQQLENVDFIIISGNISLGSITILLQEYFHPDHGEYEKHALILVPHQPDSDMKRLIKLYKNKLFYFEGDCLKLNDLERVLFRKAKMIMLLANKQTDNDTEEDAKTIMQAMAIKKHFMLLEQKEKKSRKRYNKNQNFVKLKGKDDDENVQEKNNKLIMQLIKPESEHHFELSISANNSRDQIVCINELKLGLISKSCLCRGIITLLTNLISTNNVVEDNDKAKKILEENEWMSDYTEGKDYEIYKISLNSKRGYYFGDLVNIVYNTNNGAILFGLHIESKDTQDSIVYLSPLGFKLPKKDQSISIYGYLLAKDQNEANIVMNNLKAENLDLANLKFKKVGRVMPGDPFESFNPYSKINGYGDFQEEDEKHDNNLFIETDRQGKYLTDKIILSDSYHVCSDQIQKENAIYSTLQNKLVLKRGHIIICGICQNLIDFIKPLRAKYIPKEDCPSIVILSNELPDDKVWNSISYFDEIFLVQGNPLERKDLLRAGILSASKVVILSPSISEISTFKTTSSTHEKEEDNNSSSARGLTREEENLLDAKTIFKYNLVTEMNNDVFCLIELINPNNISFLNNKNRNNDEYVIIKAGFDITLTTSFASGEVYYSNVMDNLMSQIYYNPNLLGVIKKIIMGEGQKKIINNSLRQYYNVKSGNLYLIDMPPLEDFKEISDEKDSEKSDNKSEINFKVVFQYLLMTKKMIAIGVYKENIKKKSALPINETKKRKTLIKGGINIFSNSEENFYYVVTSPSPDFKVTNRDKLFVMSTIYPGKNFGAKVNLNNQIQKDDNQFNMEKNEIEKHSNKIKSFEAKQNLDQEGERKLEHLNKTIEEMKVLLATTKKSLCNLGPEAKQKIEESIRSTIQSIYSTNNLPDTK